MRKVTLEFVLMLKEEYDAGASITQLSKKYNTDVNYAFNKFNISRKTKLEFIEWKKNHRRHSSYTLKWDCSSINNEYEAYIIGLFMADGYISKNQAGLRLKKSDKNLVEQVKNYFSEDIKLQEDINSFSFAISSAKVCDNLEKLGVLRHKTFKELHIPTMNYSLVRHFIRGFFDGDGSIFLCKHNSNIYFKSNICSPTKNILEEIQLELKKVNIESTINLEHRIGKEFKLFNSTIIGSIDMYRLFIRKKNSIEKWYHYLYDNSTIYLERKFYIFNNNLELFKYKKIRSQVNTELT